MANCTELGLEVKKKLLGPPTRTQAWLAKMVSQRTGLSVDDAYLSKILYGQRKSPRVVEAICEVLDIQHST